jgi:hypothetical protein
VNRAAGLLLAKIADILEDPDSAVSRSVPVPSAAEDLADLVSRIDLGKPADTVNVGGRTSTVPRADAGYRADTTASAAAPTSGGSATVDGVSQSEARTLEAPFLENAVLDAVMRELYEEFGAASFTELWRDDRPGLLREALVLLDDLRLARPVPGGVAVLPAAARYRNIKAAVSPRGRRDGQLALDFSALFESSEPQVEGDAAPTYSPPPDPSPRPSPPGERPRAKTSEGGDS